ncbi:hypothetical protein N7468_000447 [Penicillium chermesinum]|uniref:aminodeoxychorismate synthase n=1 Tax=Penicillium chermesinum TaxID=63820 RepID=A0A9W9PKB6_9EURO|nr:uncharacterized protein N7468_000447 [Penicillium chermesinum]KAJ5248996.1 hypothetical protein N7468_000447 [Penicillium chermesinum]
MKDIWSLHEADLVPVLGICLGFQSLCLHHGVPIKRLPYPLHGQVHQIATSSRDLFDQIPRIEVTLYHSLYANVEMSGFAPESQVNELDFLAWLSLGDSDRSTQIPMAVKHQSKPFWGVQFHPESCKSETQACKKLLQNWWRMALAFNKVAGREGYGSSPEAIISPQADTSSFPTIAYEMHRWTSSTSKRSAYRSFGWRPDGAETISELFNRPGAPTVLFNSEGRFTTISIPSSGSWRLEYSVKLQKVSLYQLGGDHRVVEEKITVGQLWDALRYLMDMKKVTHGSDQSPFWGGFLGYFSYELSLSGLPHSNQSSSFGGSTSPDGSSNKISLEDPPRCQLALSTCGQDDSASGWLDQASELIQRDQHESETEGADSDFMNPILHQAVFSFPQEADYKNRIAACKAELEAGESYELCLSCETTITLPTASTDSGKASFPWSLYKRLKKYNPARFSAFANLGNTKIVSSSPECFLNWDREDTLEMKPMKGTVRKTPDMTLEKAKEILASTKEMAENLMIADLIRHDLYGICGSGGVHVEKLLEVEDYGRVYSMITHVKGKIHPEAPGYSVRHMPQLKSSNMAVHGLTTLQRCLPPGSMTGAPKERSCMHLQTIENRKRGIYSGVMGYLDLGGGGSFSVMIRMAFTHSSTADQDTQQVWRIGAGGAITTLSTAEGEWQEMLTKLRTVDTIFAPFDVSGESR